MILKNYPLIPRLDRKAGKLFIPRISIFLGGCMIENPVDSRLDHTARRIGLCHREHILSESMIAQFNHREKPR